MQQRGRDGHPHHQLNRGSDAGSGANETGTRQAGCGVPHQRIERSLPDYRGTRRIRELRPMNIELITDVDCPNVEAARAVLREALDSTGLPHEWTEWDRGAESSPPYARRYGSPTVLVDGNDVSDEGGAADGNCCRIYPDEAGGFLGTPSRESVVEALKAAG